MVWAPKFVSKAVEGTEQWQIKVHIDAMSADEKMKVLLDAEAWMATTINELRNKRKSGNDEAGENPPRKRKRVNGAATPTAAAVVRRQGGPRASAARRHGPRHVRARCKLAIAYTSRHEAGGDANRRRYVPRPKLQAV